MYLAHARLIEEDGIPGGSGNRTADQETGCREEKEFLPGI